MLKADLVELATFDTEVAARLAAGSLEGAGIEVVIERQDPAGLVPITGRAAGARLFISSEDRERAQAFLICTNRWVPALRMAPDLICRACRWVQSARA